VHFTGTVRLGPAAAAAPRAAAPTRDGQHVVLADDIYRVYFHGPAYQVLTSAWQEAGTVVGELAHDLPSDHQPSSLPFLVAPRLIELCFQTAGLRELGHEHRFGLPHHVDRVRVWSTAAASSAGTWAVVRPTADGFDAQVVDASGAVGAEVAGYRTIELPGGLDSDQLAPLSAAMG
jgi:hypothetical protein